MVRLPTDPKLRPLVWCGPYSRSRRLGRVPGAEPMQQIDPLQTARQGRNVALSTSTGLRRPIDERNGDTDACRAGATTG